MFKCMMMLFVSIIKINLILDGEMSFQSVHLSNVILQDCWSSHNRTLTGDLQPDPDRFPHGIKYLADYVSRF